MKGEYLEEQKDHPNTTTTTMFPKIHQTQKFLPQPYSTSVVHHQHHHFQLAAARDSQTSEEADSQTTTTPNTTKKELASTSSAGNDGASIEVVRRPRGRPPGSKNKPKPPVIITRDTEPSMSPYVLEIPGGSDIIDSLTTYCRRRHSGLCILNGSGTVANVTIKQPSTTPGATVTFHGRFDILSLSGNILPSLQQHHHFVSAQIGNNFTISLAGPQGQIVGGAVVGPLLAAATVYVIAASFNNPTYHQLPVEDDRRSIEQGNNHNNAGANDTRSPSGVSGGGDSGHGPPSALAEGGLSIYSSQLPSDVVWAPTARQPPPQHHY